MVPKRIAVLGLGNSGASVLSFFLRVGSTVLVWDDREDVRAQAEKQGAIVEEFPDWNTIETLVSSPGIDSFAHPFAVRARAAGVIPVSDISLFLSLFPRVKQTIGVTGTNGKSTTCSLIAHSLREEGIPCVLAGNIGRPIFSTIEGEEPGDAIYVLEISSYQLQLTSKPLGLSVSAITNLSAHHLERHGGMEQYCQEKMKILLGAEHRIIGTDNVHTRCLFERLQGQATSVSSVGDIRFSDAGIWDGDKGIPWPDNSWFSRPHNRQNAAMAYAVLRHFGVSVPKWDNFMGLRHRQEMLGWFGNTLCVNDSKATNPEAAARAIRSFSGMGALFWIGGGVLQEDFLEELERVAPLIRGAFLIGESAPRFAEMLNTLFISCEISHTLDQAVSAAMLQASKEEKAVVLFSPACPSFDQFRDFEQRGDAFVTCVKNHSEKAA